MVLFPLRPEESLDWEGWKAPAKLREPQKSSSSATRQATTMFEQVTKNRRVWGWMTFFLEAWINFSQKKVFWTCRRHVTYFSWGLATMAIWSGCTAARGLPMMSFALQDTVKFIPPKNSPAGQLTSMSYWASFPGTRPTKDVCTLTANK